MTEETRIMNDASVRFDDPLIERGIGSQANPKLGSVPSAAPSVYDEILSYDGRERAATLSRLLRLYCRNDSAFEEELAGRALIENPKDRVLVEEFIDRYNKSRPGAPAIDWLVGLQSRLEEPINSIILTLNAHLGRNEVRSRLEGIVNKAQKLPGVNATLRAWSSYYSGSQISASDARVVSENRDSCVQMTFAFVLKEPRQILLNESSSISREVATNLGIKLDEIRDHVEDLKEIRSGFWREELARAPITLPEARVAMMEAEAECSILDKIVEDGSLSMVDPLTGRLVAASDSLIAFGRTVFIFHGKTTFFLILGKPWSSPIGYFIPEMNVSISFGKGPSGFLGKDIPNVLTAILQRAARAAMEKGDAISEGVGDSDALPILISVGHTENFAHHVWNFYSCLERLCSSGSVEKVSAIGFSGTEFFGPLDEIFPELKKINFKRTKRKNVIGASDLGFARGLVLPTGGYFIPESLSRRIIKYAESIPKQVSRGGYHVVEPADIKGLEDVPVIWLGLRLRDKSWEDQEEGSIEIIQRIAASYPKSIFLLDGFSYPVGHDQISDHWTDVIEPLYQMGERIKSRSGLSGSVVNLVGNTLRESVLWASRTTAYLAPFGTSQHKIGWFSDAPGLVYVPANFSPSNVRRSPACAASGLASEPEFIYASPLSQGERRGFNRNRERFFNVSVDADYISKRLINMIENHGYLKKG